jgi:membrane-bound lytic murein transglycosylase D
MNTIFSRTALFSVVFISGLSLKSQETGVEAPIADMLDSLSSQKMFEAAFQRPIFNKNNKYHFSEDSVPTYDDYTYQARLAKLDVASPFDLVYNPHVKGFINLYTVRKRESVTRMMGMAQLYYPMFEEVLDKYNIPLELKHLAVIESALVPQARSRVGATGLWQFMYPTGKMYGLNVTSYIDERCDPYKATVAAAEYLKNLYDMFGDWQMVLAAYNAGPGTISKAIRRSGGKRTYWEIRPWLPVETQGYVPAFIAANYVMTHGPEHNLYPALPKKTYFEVDTIVLKYPMSFDQLSRTLNVTTEELVYFNPQYRKNVIPAGGHALCLPKTKIAYFLNNEQNIYATIEALKQSGETEEVVAEVKRTHTVRSGEKLSTIARKYGVTVADLKSWNVIGRRGIGPGKKLTVYVREQTSVAKAKPAAQTIQPESTDDKQLAQKSAKSEFTSYKVKKGDNLYGIAKKFGVRSTTIVEDNNLRSKELRYGQVLRIRN